MIKNLLDCNNIVPQVDVVPLVVNVIVEAYRELTHIFTTALDTAKVEKFPVVNRVVVPVSVVVDIFVIEALSASIQFVTTDTDDTLLHETVDIFTC